MRKIFLFIAISMSISAFSQMKWNTAYQQYINQYKDIAIEQMQRYRIPASITLAQGLLESAAGRTYTQQQQPLRYKMQQQLDRTPHISR